MADNSKQVEANRRYRAKLRAEGKSARGKDLVTSAQKIIAQNGGAEVFAKALASNPDWKRTATAILKLQS